MFAVLDTNHYVALIAGGPLSITISRRATEVDADIFTTIITPQEITQGWLAAINREQAGRDQLFSYARFQHNLLAFSKLPILPFDQEAAETFHQLRRDLPRTGTMDLKIAAVCLAHDATLLTRNVADFQNIPGLRVENWLD
ncbi:MAG: type II toxin-antitoxin system VapC family toxin [Verrucomicrobia bacterium]|nr:type II toxin-antitoxin system VapC family toxin [Verrucomicrobiota bacterium]